MTTPREPQGLKLPSAAAKPLALRPSAPAGTPVVAPTTPLRPSEPRAMGLAPPAPPRPPAARDPIDAMIEHAVSIDPSLIRDSHKLLPRLRSLVNIDARAMMNFGERNLAIIPKAADIQTKATARMAQIDADGWIRKTKEESCKIPGFLDRFKSDNTPEFFERMLGKARAELGALMDDMTRLRPDVAPEERDLLLDAIAIQVWAPTIADSSLASMADNRLRLLLASQQSVVTILHMMDQTTELCAASIMEIDRLLTLTIPQWKLAFKR